MKYLFLIYSREISPTAEERARCTAKSMALCQELNAKGQFRGASPLQPSATATSVRMRNGQHLVTAGPFAETTEQLGGYYLLDVPNLDEAITIAARLPAAEQGTVEIRPVLSIEGLPADKNFATKEHHQKVMLICYDDEQAWDSAGQDVFHAAISEAVKMTHQLDAEGKFLTASPLHPVATATSVRVRDGKRIVTDGPFAETREVVGGYYLLVVKDTDEAIEIAARHPGLRYGGVEIRPVIELPPIT